ncbi:hypothetical protein F5144DRAFT_580029 [Chaetomium tenue]|uniref:Uncharacterized protein n=1 Tax=Chaetomium tenue TaxID=1854479 RepID=A0ACB7P777_9PEZI|nr:hypothetical protein F5144DRAFT_580029 [Chaetomium globosum]
MYRSAAAIEGWLSQFDIHSKRKRPTPLQCRSMSSKKRKLDADVDLNHVQGPMPCSSRPPRTAGFDPSKSIPLHAPAPSSILSSASQPGISVPPNKTATTKRSSSPVRNTDSLRYLDKPVIYGHLRDAKQLPADAATLWNAVYPVVKFTTCIFPTEIRSEISSLYLYALPERIFGTTSAKESKTRKGLGEDARKNTSLDSTITMQDEFPDQLPAVWAFARASTQPSVTPQRLALAEFLAARNINRETWRCMDGKYSEAAWNSRVHEPLLDLALFRHGPHVGYVNATSAKIRPAFMPSLSTGKAIAEGKMVDFVMTRCLDYKDPVAADAELDVAIRAKLQRQPDSWPLTVNQTDYTPLTRSPVAVAIGTKALALDASMEEGRVQFAVWTAAWHRRMEALGIGNRGQTPLPTLPLILTMGHEWTLYFACDRGTTIEILRAMDIGSTNDLEGVYKLLDVLRLLADWIDDVFYQWAVSAFIPRVDEASKRDNPKESGNPGPGAEKETAVSD